MEHRRLLLGIGNRLRGDDAVGPLVVDSLKSELNDLNIQLSECNCDPGLMISSWENFDQVIIVDAISDPSKSVGSIVQFDAAKHELPADFKSSSTHTVGLATAVELARALGSLPKDLLILGVVGNSYSYGKPPSAAVAAAIPEVKNLILSYWSKPNA
jgi:hydrogenase maturation protease